MLHTRNNEMVIENMLQKFDDQFMSNISFPKDDPAYDKEMPLNLRLDLELKNQLHLNMYQHVTRATFKTDNSLNETRSDQTAEMVAPFIVRRLFALSLEQE